MVQKLGDFHAGVHQEEKKDWARYGTITPHFIAAHKSAALLIMPRETRKNRDNPRLEIHFSEFKKYG